MKTTAARALMMTIACLAAGFSFSVGAPSVVRAQDAIDPIDHCRRVGTQDDPPGEAPPWMRAMAPSASPLCCDREAMGYAATTAGIGAVRGQPPAIRNASDGARSSCTSACGRSGSLKRTVKA